MKFSRLLTTIKSDRYYSYEVMDNKYEYSTTRNKQGGRKKKKQNNSLVVCLLSSCAACKDLNKNSLWLWWCCIRVRIYIIIIKNSGLLLLGLVILFDCRCLIYFFSMLCSSYLLLIFSWTNARAAFQIIRRGFILLAVKFLVKLILHRAGATKATLWQWRTDKIIIKYASIVDFLS